MINGEEFTTAVKTYFQFLITEYGFALEQEEIWGSALYKVEFKDADKVVSISYENISDYLLIIIFMLDNGRLPDYNDETKMLHLNQLTARLFTLVGKEEIDANNLHFTSFAPSDEVEKKLLKAAKELRLCLQHFGQLVH